MRNLFEKIKIEQANRVILEDTNKDLIKKCDVEKVISTIKTETKPSRVIGFAS